MIEKYFLCLAVLLLLKCICSDCHLVLSVSPMGKMIVSRENEDLNLTCKVMSEEGPNDHFDLTWMLPTRSNANGDRISIYETDTELTVTIHNLQEDDSGQYICELSNKGIVRTKKVSVFVRAKKCFKPFFDCGNGLCIPKHYVCDGYIDCPSGYDESFTHCGPDACHGKVLCDGRCIPKELCCDRNIDTNCTVNYVMPCCHRVLNPIVELESSKCSSSVDCHLSHIFGFGNSMLYIVASCAIVVTLVSSILMIVVCRICARNNQDTQGNPTLGHQYLTIGTHTDTPLDTINLGLLFDETHTHIPQSVITTESTATEDFVLLNYVNGYGFELADYGPKPPPYSENTMGVPPPPYVSMIDVSNAVSESCSQNMSNVTDT